MNVGTNPRKGNVLSKVTSMMKNPTKRIVAIDPKGILGPKLRLRAVKTGKFLDDAEHLPAGTCWVCGTHKAGEFGTAHIMVEDHRAEGKGVRTGMVLPCCVKHEVYVEPAPDLSKPFTIELISMGIRDGETKASYGQAVGVMFRDADGGVIGRQAIRITAEKVSIGSMGKAFVALGRELIRGNIVRGSDVLVGHEAVHLKETN